MGQSTSQERHWSDVELQEEKYQGLSVIDNILNTYRVKIGDDFQGYRNHCVRVYLYCLYLIKTKPEDTSVFRKLAVALAFHDIGLWTAGTIDYLDPSRIVAVQYLNENNLSAWVEEVGEMIDRHHQILLGDLQVDSLTNIMRMGEGGFRLHSPTAVTLFALRSSVGDLVDFSWGWVRNGLSRATVRQVQQLYPNAGFHLTLLRYRAPCRWCFVERC